MATDSSLSHETVKWGLGVLAALLSATFGYTLSTERRLTTLETSYQSHLVNVQALTQNNERRLATIEAAQAQAAHDTNEKLDEIADNVALIQGALRLKTSH